MFAHLWEKISNNGVIFLQETFSTEDTFSNWRDNFKEELSKYKNVTF